MERIEVRASSAGAEDLAYIRAAVFTDDSVSSTRIAHLRGDLYRDRTLHVDVIKTSKAWRRKDVATRLLLHTIEVLGVRAITANTVNERADAFFRRIETLCDGVSVETD